MPGRQIAHTYIRTQRCRTRQTGSNPSLAWKTGHQITAGVMKINRMHQTRMHAQGLDTLGHASSMSITSTHKDSGGEMGWTTNGRDLDGVVLTGIFLFSARFSTFPLAASNDAPATSPPPSQSPLLAQSLLFLVIYLIISPPPCRSVAPCMQSLQLAVLV